MAGFSETIGFDLYLTLSYLPQELDECLSKYDNMLIRLYGEPKQRDYMFSNPRKLFNFFDWFENKLVVLVRYMNI